MSYKKVKTVLVYGKKKCIYMKPKGTREYVKSKGEYVLLPVYVKRVAKIAAKKLVKIKNGKNGKKKIRGGEHELLSLQVINVNNNKVLDLCIRQYLNAELVLLSKENVVGYELENNLENIKILVKNEDKYLDKDKILIIKAKNKTDVEFNSMSNCNYRVKGSPYEGTTYYKRDNKGKIEKIYSEKINCETKYGVVYYYHIFNLKNDETIYSEKKICNLHIPDIQQPIKFDSDGNFIQQIPRYNYNTSPSIDQTFDTTKFNIETKFNIDCVENILSDYEKLLLSGYGKLYIYLNDEYIEVEVPHNLLIENFNALEKYRKKNNNSKYPVTHTRITSFKTPKSQSKRVTADLVNARRSSSNAVEVNPDDLLINRNKAYEESHKKSFFSKLTDALSKRITRRITGRNTHPGPSLYDGRRGGSRKYLSSLKKNK
jgi:hypothetical protein